VRLPANSPEGHDPLLALGSIEQPDTALALSADRGSRGAVDELHISRDIPEYDAISVDLHDRRCINPNRNRHSPFPNPSALHGNTHRLVNSLTIGTGTEIFLPVVANVQFSGENATFAPASAVSL
jgi:hypothetical protein